MGISRIIEKKTKLKFFWDRMNCDIVNWVNSCEICSQRKRAQNPIRAHINFMPRSEPFEGISTDISGPLATCKNTQNRYVLVFVDYFTKFVEMIRKCAKFKRPCRWVGPFYISEELSISN